jgi:hypothetical protein
MFISDRGAVNLISTPVGNTKGQPLRSSLSVRDGESSTAAVPVTSDILAFSSPMHDRIPALRCYAVVGSEVASAARGALMFSRALHTAGELVRGVNMMVPRGWRSRFRVALSASG